MWPYDQNNQPMYQQYANAWDQGSYQQIPHHEAWQNYNQFVQNAPPQYVEQIHQQYYEQMPAQQRGGLLQSLLSGLMQRGIYPQQMGIQNSDPYSMSPYEGARMTMYAQQQHPDLLHQVFGPGGALGSTGAKLAVAGIAALAAKEFVGAGYRHEQAAYRREEGGYGRRGGLAREEREIEHEEKELHREERELRREEGGYGRRGVEREEREIEHEEKELRREERELRREEGRRDFF